MRQAQLEKKTSQVNDVNEKLDISPFDYINKRFPFLFEIDLITKEIQIPEILSYLK